MAYMGYVEPLFIVGNLSMGCGILLVIAENLSMGCEILLVIAENLSTGCEILLNIVGSLSTGCGSSKPVVVVVNLVRRGGIVGTAHPHAWLMVQRWRFPRYRWRLSHHCWHWRQT